MAALQFAPWSSDIELPFFASLANIKLNHDKLDDSARKILGLYEVRPTDAPERSSRMQILASALHCDEAPAGYYRADGIIKNVNTIEEYRNFDRSAAIERAGRIVWDAICDGTIYSCPSLLSSFTVISYADLKNYKFTYHFGFPAIHSDPTWKRVGDSFKLSDKETTGLVDSVQTWKYSVDSRQHGFFLAKRVRKQHLSTEEGEDERPKSPQTPGAMDEYGYAWAVGALGAYEQGFFNDTDLQDRFVGFADPSTYQSNPGWMLRNLLVLIRQRWRLNDVQILCYRDTHRGRDRAQSIILNLQCPQPATVEIDTSLSAAGTSPRPRTPKMPKVTGWERNEAGKLTSRLIDLSAYMDPSRMADYAVDLNLKLMKWRIAPSLDLEVIKNTKCLLLGAGTLGSYVSRNLMGWGVRKITFVDNGRVKYSNPVRQPLFDHKDCLEGGAQKAYRAAEVLQEIYPGMDATGFVMSVPMAGSPVLEEEKTRQDFEVLKKLIDDHDAIFLLMDTRESRWLPTVMGKAAGKIVLNAALGFDSLVVMRHGLKPGGPGEEEMGCYFCNDVVAPADSLKDITLDQQCTVTRPAVAPIASGLLVELLVSCLQHPLRAHAPAPSPSTATADPSNPGPGSLRSKGATEASIAASATPVPVASTNAPSPFKHPLGLIPHQLRMFMSTFSLLSIRGQPYDCCSACSDRIVDRYKSEGWAFVKRALGERGFVEEVSGLAEVQRRAEEVAGAVEWDDEDDELGGGGGTDDLEGEPELL
ncbi:uncharacterized protein K452DRAFT_282570 [Aplosporella prunicola CBS 121167]|uniref:Ubiquitin-like modifier-activating enzyme ATG7 n=1 Tax=Aplosporella prunicola CBS 121167 TaxID=1176127 RepID=A0A6A6BXH9_9PEZI|nr:uncharacterized protein K452DRAFT_282570 [Aplosporella prunicola CBS 121167]KAF2147564.1 hypothetical protein K452DRAFT_282570 [Aplosporella prunicola CBS 121167]